MGFESEMEGYMPSPQEHAAPEWDLPWFFYPFHGDELAEPMAVDSHLACEPSHVQHACEGSPPLHARSPQAGHLPRSTPRVEWNISSPSRHEEGNAMVSTTKLIAVDDRHIHIFCPSPSRRARTEASRPRPCAPPPQKEKEEEEEECDVSLFYRRENTMASTTKIILVDRGAICIRCPSPLKEEE